MVSCYHILHFRCSRILYDVVSPSLSCYKVVFIWLNPILLVLACFCFIIMCYLLCYRTDSALKFGWFFLCYSASFIYIFLAVTIHYVRVLLSAFLFFYFFIPHCLQTVPHSVLRSGCSCTSNYLQRKISHVSYLQIFSFFLFNLPPHFLL